MEDMTSLNHGGGATLPASVAAGPDQQEVGENISGHEVNKSFCGTLRVIPGWFRKVGWYCKTDNKIDKGANTNYNSNMTNYNLENKNASKAHSKTLVPYCLSNLVSFKKAAFTLAEVLITLGIIGIVAALTIPTLVSNYQKRQTVVKLKKVFADINNAVKLSEVDNGPAYTWEYPQNDTSSDETLFAFIKKYYLPYYKSAKLYDVYNFDKNYHVMQMNKDEKLPTIANYLVLSDGTILSFFSNLPAGYLWIFADINGKNPPNIVGRDVFVFTGYIRTAAQSRTYGRYSIRFWSKDLGDTNIVTRDDLTNPSSMYGCSKAAVMDDFYGAGFYCGALIQYDGWKIADDYPW